MRFNTHGLGVADGAGVAVGVGVGASVGAGTGIANLGSLVAPVTPVENLQSGGIVSGCANFVPSERSTTMVLVAMIYPYEPYCALTLTRNER